MPPKGSSRKKYGGAGAGGVGGGAAGATAAGSSDGSATPHLPSLAEQLSYMHLPRPFKNPAYNKNVNRRAKNMKAIISQERERERAERERRRALGKAEAEAMEVDNVKSESTEVSLDPDLAEEVPTYTSIEAPPSVWPPKHYCDITGLEAPYTDPSTGLRFHDKSIYDLVKGLSTSTAKDYLSARGVSTVVK